MSKFVIDADALIKLGKAGILAALLEAHEILIPTAVYEEAVVTGKQEMYEDAFVLEEVLKRGEAGVVRREGDEETVDDAARASLGPGERDAFVLYRQEWADAVLSDDRVFLGFLEENGVPYLTPTAVVVDFAGSERLPLDEAFRVLEGLKGYVRRAVYESARRTLEEKRDGR